MLHCLFLFSHFGRKWYLFIWSDDLCRRPATFSILNCCVHEAEVSMVDSVFYVFFFFFFLNKRHFWTCSPLSDYMSVCSAAVIRRAQARSFEQEINVAVHVWASHTRTHNKEKKNLRDIYKSLTLFRLIKRWQNVKPGIFFDIVISNMNLKKKTQNPSAHLCSDQHGTTEPALTSVWILCWSDSI